MPVQPAMREPGIARDVGYAHTGQPPLAVQAGCRIQDALPVLCGLCFGNLHESPLLIAVVRKNGFAVYDDDCNHKGAEPLRLTV